MTIPEAPYQPTDRRPITARRWPIWQRVVTGLVAAKVTANTISVMGMIAGGLAGVAFVLTRFELGFERAMWLAAAALMQLRLLANLLDGMVAIESGQASPVGELYNEVPDRVSDTAILIGAGFAVGGDVVLGFLAACGALFTAYVRAMGKASGAVQEYCGPMAKPQRMAILTIAALYLAFAPIHWQPMLGTPQRYGLISLVLAVIVVGCGVTSVRRLLRIAKQLRGRTA